MLRATHCEFLKLLYCTIFRIHAIFLYPLFCIHAIFFYPLFYIHDIFFYPLFCIHAIPISCTYAMFCSIVPMLFILYPCYIFNIHAIYLISLLYIIFMLQ